jgi:[calcium/calmodulin-dependent protein kinase] kinase
MLCREIAIMKKLDHPNVVKLYEAVEDFETNEVFLVMEYIEHGAVMPETVQCEPLPLDKCWDYFRQLVSALEYCHANGVIHCDIKPANLLLAGDLLKVADFGTSRLIGEHEKQTENVFVVKEHTGDMVSKVMGTSAFLSPQAHSGNSFSGTQNDVWSVGVTLFFFVFGKCPFEGESIVDVHENVIQQPLVVPTTRQIPDTLKDLLVQLMEKDQEKRISLPQIMGHPWVTKNGQAPLHAQFYKPIEVTDEDCLTAVKLHKPTVVMSIVRGLSKLRSNARSPQVARPRTRIAKTSELMD